MTTYLQISGTLITFIVGVFTTIKFWIEITNILEQRKERKKKLIAERTPEISVFKTYRNKTKVLKIMNQKDAPIIGFTLELLEKEYEIRIYNLKNLQPRDLKKGDEIELWYTTALGQKNNFKFKMKWQDIYQKEYEEIREIELN